MKSLWKAVSMVVVSTLSWHVLYAATPAKVDTIPEPSFSCGEALTMVERAICADPGLSRQDRQLASLFAYAVQQSPDPAPLRKAQRAWLRKRDFCTDLECMAGSYAARIEMLSTYTGAFDTAQSEKLCRKFLNSGARTAILGEPATAVDINNDGVVERAKACFGGTMNIPCAEYEDSAGNTLGIEKEGFAWEDYWTLGERPFRFEGRTYIYRSFDDALAEPAYLSYVTPLNREVLVCDFENAIDSALPKGSAKVCQAISENDSAIEAVQLPTTPAPVYSVMGRRETSSSAQGLIDIDNDGVADPVMELQYSSGAGRGCDYNYFALASSDTNARGGASHLLDELQGISDDGRPERCFGWVHNGLFRFEGKTYFEANRDNHVSLQRTVRFIDRGAVNEVCAFERRIRSTIKSVGHAPGEDGGSGGTRTHD